MVPLPCHLKQNTSIELFHLKITVFDNSFGLKLLLFLFFIAVFNLRLVHRIAAEKSCADPLLPRKHRLKRQVGKALAPQVLLNAKLAVQLQHSKIYAFLIKHFALVPGAIFLATAAF